MNKECSVCKGSGRQRWWRNPSLSIKREDGSSPGGPSKWVPARKNDTGRRTRSCERCKGCGIDPRYIEEMKLEAKRARHERERIRERVYYMNEKIRGTRCANKYCGSTTAKLHKCPTCGWWMCDSCCYEDGNCKTHG